jgi:hypothetical protein
MTSTRPLVAALLLLPLLGGCASWREPVSPPVALISTERPPVIRLTRADGRVLTVERPTIARDSIVGSTDDGLTRTAASDVVRLEVPRLNVTRTVALSAAQAGAVVGLIVVIVDLLPHYRGF